MASYVFTPWGYEADELTPIITAERLLAITGGKHSDVPPEQLEAAISAASAAVRNVCGWHVSPALDCRARLTAGDELTGERTRVLALPAAMVQGVYSVTENGTELGAGEFECLSNGLMRRTCFKAWANNWNAIEVEYRAGFESAPDLESAVAHVVEAALTVPVGVKSEAAGGVSISYETNVSAIAAMTASQLSGALSAYKVVRSYAA